MTAGVDGLGARVGSGYTDDGRCIQIWALSQPLRDAFSFSGIDMLLPVASTDRKRRSSSIRFYSPVSPGFVKMEYTHPDGHLGLGQMLVLEDIVPPWWNDCPRGPLRAIVPPGTPCNLQLFFAAPL
jgi:hypothetical protein